MSPSCALLGGFAIGARVALLWQHNTNAKRQRVLVLALCLVVTATSRRKDQKAMTAVADAADCSNTESS